MKREAQLKRDGDLEQYNAEIQALVDRKVVCVLRPEEVGNEPAWYLNHRGVVHPDKKSTTIRIVLDSAAVYKGHSLNRALEKGPGYINSLLRCFIAWREKEVGETGDISQMFNQIALHRKDQPYHRSL